MTIVFLSRFCRVFIEECDVIVSGKLNCARQNTVENVKLFDKLTKELQDTERKRREVINQ
jgi:hypothetical protein